jgi:ABC-type multidrug transport system permease subunit
MAISSRFVVAFSHNSNQPKYWPLGQMILSRVKEFVREPAALFWVYGFPILMTSALAIAFRNRPVEQTTVDIVEGPRTVETQKALQPTTTSERFKTRIVSEEEARMRLRTGKTDVVVVPVTSSESHDSASNDGERTKPQVVAKLRYEYRFDPTRPPSVLARGAVDDQLQHAAGRKDVAEVTVTAVDEPGGRYIDFLVPGLLAMGLMGGGLWGVGFVIVDMRVRKLLKRFLATPMKKSEFLAAIMGSRMLFMVPEVLFLLLFARYVCGVVNQGSVIAVIMLVLIGSVMFSGIGLLVASRANTIEAVSGMMNLVMMPMWIFSGIFFSSERFPDAVQPLIKALPLTPLIDSLRSVMLEGAPLLAQFARIGIMVAWGAISFALALRRFRWS